MEIKQEHFDQLMQVAKQVTKNEWIHMVNTITYAFKEMNEELSNKSTLNDYGVKRARYGIGKVIKFATDGSPLVFESDESGC